MDNSQQREEELFDEASQIKDPVKLRAFLDKSCGDDHALRRNLDALLSFGQKADEFFTEGREAISELLPANARKPEPSSASPGDGNAVGEYIGKQIGRYRLLEKLGEGGWGVVYLAEQKEPVQRQVALKIIRVGMETKGIVARFEVERQALAMMDHPNIARVYDAGETDRGFPYFVMELVRGEKITNYCNRNRLDLEQRLHLFIQVCHAIQHAHQKGVIHRDIKPSNIMVSMIDGVPVPKVIDFGIAKATESGLNDQATATAYVQLIGTPAYMSPEQAEMRWMDVDTRSDIYSLGVLLYELLTNKTPFDPKALMAAGVDGMRSLLRDKEPPRPSARLLALNAIDLSEIAFERRMDPGRLISLLKGDLDWVAMKALEKDRQRRYETANGLSLDISRHLNFEAVSARPPSWVYRLQKTMRRNRVLFAAGGAVTLALIAGMGTSTWLLFKERDARHRAVAAEQIQATLRKEAETREQITQVTLLVNQERFEEANQLLSKLQIDKPSVEAAAAYRSLGEWHALSERWSNASAYFLKLVQLDELDGWDVTTLDDLRVGPSLVCAKDSAAYSRFRLQALAAYKANPHSATDRVLKICLLTPPDDQVFDTLKSLAEASYREIAKAENNRDSFKSAWLALSLSIWELRAGNHQAAADLARRCLACPEQNPPRWTTAQAVLTMALFKLGHTSEATLELKKATDIINAKFDRQPMDRGAPVQGFWFDWIYARLFTKEAAALVTTKRP